MAGNLKVSGASRCVKVGYPSTAGTQGAEFRQIHFPSIKRCSGACEEKKPCAPYRKVERKTGTLTPDAPACHSCAFHFREFELCEGCRKLSMRLSKRVPLGHGLRVCQRWARGDHETCYGGESPY